MRRPPCKADLRVFHGDVTMWWRGWIVALVVGFMLASPVSRGWATEAARSKAIKSVPAKTVSTATPTTENVTANGTNWADEDTDSESIHYHVLRPRRRSPLSSMGRLGQLCDEHEDSPAMNDFHMSDWNPSLRIAPLQRISLVVSIRPIMLNASLPFTKWITHPRGPNIH
jgi:hypothetical protein